MEKKHNSIAFPICAALVGFLFGYWCAVGFERAPTEGASQLPGVRANLNGQTPPRRWRSTFNGRTNDLLAKSNITEEDISLASVLEKQRRSGEFVLQSESPIIRKLQRSDFAHITAEAATNNAAAYRQLFSELGIAPHGSEQLQRHLAKIHQASLEAEVAIGQVLDARRKYDKRIRSLLDDKNYLKYRQYEAAKPAREEVANIRKLFHGNEGVLNPEQERRLIQLIHEVRATETWWHGPYDQLPDMLLGCEENLPRAEEKLHQTTLSSSNVLNRLKEAGLSEQHRNIMSEYYLNKIVQKQQVVEALKRHIAEMPVQDRIRLNTSNDHFTVRGGGDSP